VAVVGTFMHSCFYWDYCKRVCISQWF